MVAKIPKCSFSKLKLIIFIVLFCFFSRFLANHTIQSHNTSNHTCFYKMRLPLSSSNQKCTMSEINVLSMLLCILYLSILYCILFQGLLIITRVLNCTIFFINLISYQLNLYHISLSSAK